MRIVAGKHKGRPLKAPKTYAIRPTSDRARESLFNILVHGGSDVDGTHVLDVFSGTGALGLEALSRGAASAVFMDNDAMALDLARENVETLSEKKNVTLMDKNATAPGPVKGKPANLIFLDPPYGSGLARETLEALFEGGWVAPEATLIVEVGKFETFVPPQMFRMIKESRQGAAKFVILRY